MLSLFFANIIGWIVAHRRMLLIIVGAIVLLILIFSIRSCFKKTPKIDPEQIQKINKANEADRKKELEKIITENADTVKTVDERTEISETNIVERTREIDEKIKEVDKKIVEAKSQNRDVTQAELVCLLQPENCQ